jgi:hypothetical protein
MQRGAQVLGGGFILIGLLILVCGGCEGETKQAQAATSPGQRSFDGVFHASVDGTRQIVNLSQRGERVTGIIGSALIDARAEGSLARGDLKDPASGAVVGSIEMLLDGDRLKLAMAVNNPQNDQKHALPAIAFQRGSPPPVDVVLDARIIGRWKHVSSIDSAAQLDTWLMLYPDGSIEHGRTAASGEPVLASISGSDDGFTGRWRTSDDVMHVIPAGNGTWIAFARYDVQSDGLSLTYNDGTRKVYQRQ